MTSRRGDKEMVERLKQDVERLAFEKQYAAMKYDELKRQFDDTQRPREPAPPYETNNPFINAPV